MSDFTLYFKLGLEHIADFAAYDHMLFIISLCAIFSLKEWKKVLILVTAFTIGHSITLALSVLDMVKVDKDLIETLIPITILITCITNIILVFAKKVKTTIWIHYSFAIFFGLIHGLGFANYLKSLLMGMGSTTLPLFAFNIGIEIGQIIIVMFYFILYQLIVFAKIPHKYWVTGLSILIGIVSINLML